ADIGSGDVVKDRLKLSRAAGRGVALALQVRLLAYGVARSTGGKSNAAFAICLKADPAAGSFLTDDVRHNFAGVGIDDPTVRADDAGETHFLSVRSHSEIIVDPVGCRCFVRC